MIKKCIIDKSMSILYEAVHRRTGCIPFVSFFVIVGVYNVPQRLLCCIFLVLMCVSGCDDAPKPKIGISFGVGEAEPLAKKGYMEERAQELGMEVETRFNKADAPKTQMQDCFELIDSGISVLILLPRRQKANKILAYAKKKNVKVISYARAVMGEDIDFFVGYDT